ncbi:MAG TPA: TIGR02757 family protein [Cyclobacteriaceae bacterium]
MLRQNTKMKEKALKAYLDELADRFNRPQFIDNDPVSIPHAFSHKQDIEIAGLFAAVLAWGQRGTIIKKCNELMDRMDRAPYAFIRDHGESDLRRLVGFRHRTFNDTDLLYFVAFLHWYYNHHESLETVFEGESIETGLDRFHTMFFSLDGCPTRTRKHISTPAKKSTCKRLNMYLRWMVRRDDRGVDFGLWRNISPASLICPCDVHVDRVARKLGLIKRKQTDWQTALELTNRLKQFDPDDPVRYDFALFGLGVVEKGHQFKPFLN